jgi:hypothetical protein
VCPRLRQVGSSEASTATMAIIWPAVCFQPWPGLCFSRVVLELGCRTGALRRVDGVTLAVLVYPQGRLFTDTVGKAPIVLFAGFSGHLGLSTSAASWKSLPSHVLLSLYRSSPQGSFLYLGGLFHSTHSNSRDFVSLIPLGSAPRSVLGLYGPPHIYGSP